MEPLQRFAEYAEAFERTFASDDFSHIEPYFSEDAAYEITGGPPFEGLHEGRDAVFGYLKASLDGFDRRFETRSLELLEGPEDRGDEGVWMRWRVRYVHPDVPELVIDGEESAIFDGDRIVRLIDRFAPGTGKDVAAYFAAHGDRLKTVA